MPVSHTFGIKKILAEKSESDALGIFVISMIYPTEAPKGLEPASRESEIYEVFASLPDRYTTLFGLHIASPEAKEREIDFLVFSDSGIFPIELKNGRYTRENGQVFLDSKEGKKIPGKGTPLEQIRSATKRLLVHTNTFRLDWKIPEDAVFPLVLFLQESNRLVFDEEAEQRHYLFHQRPQRKDLENWFSQLECKTKITEDQTKEIISHILQRQNYVFVNPIGTDFRSAVENHENHLVRLTQEQSEALHISEANPRTLIQGVAGSGKTLILLEKARREARQNQKVLFLTYNSNLNRWLDAKLSSISNIEVVTINTLLDRKPERWSNSKR